MGILCGSKAVHNQITITHCSPHENTLLKYFTKILYLKKKVILYENTSFLANYS